LISKGINPEEVLALTFTEKASTEMQERIDVALPLSYGKMWIMTFHGFCDAILRDSAIHIGLPSNYKLMTQAQSIDLIKKNLFEFELDYFRPLGNPNKFISGMLQHFSRLQDETVTPIEYLKWVKTLNSQLSTNETDKLEYVKWKELVNAYKAYDDLKIKEGKFDFGDLIIKTIELFKKRLEEVQKEPFKITDLKINGNDVMKTLKIKPGPVVGKVLNQLFNKVVDGQIKNLKPDLLAEIKKIKIN